MKEALDYLEELQSDDENGLENAVDAVYITPPESEGYISGEDDTHDDDANGIPDNLCPGQLIANCEITFADGRRIDDFECNENHEMAEPTKVMEIDVIDVIDVIRENRIPKKCPIPSKNELKKKSRGHIESTKMETTDIRLTKWVDNAVVCIASAAFGALPVSNTSRYLRETRSKISVPRPCVVTEYNKY